MPPPEPQAYPSASVVVPDDRPLIGVFDRQNGRDVTRYFSDEAEADAATQPSVTQAALAVIGAWSDLDWDETIETLDRIRRESKPTPPIDDL